MFVLASASPRRRDLLGRYLTFEVRPAGIDESVLDGERPEDYVARLAREKAAAASRTVPNGTVVVAADTTVDVDGRIVGKPGGAAEARRILAGLSGRAHRVHTGVCVGGEVFTVTTTVRFAELSPAAIDWYVATGEPLDAAGAYAIQGAGAALVASIEGSWTNVVGLPLAETLAALARAGVPVPFVPVVPG